MKRALIFVLAITLILLCGCAPAEEPAEPTTAPTEPTPAPTQPFTQPPEQDRINPLTGEPVEALTNHRAYAVAIDNSKGAMPQHGVSQADIVYEMLIEGETRCMGVYYDMASVSGSIGDIRSARRDFIRLAMAYDAIFVHNGQSPKQGSKYDNYSAEVTFAQTGWEHIDGNSTGYKYFHFERQNTHASTHTMFIKPEKILEATKDLGLTATRNDSLDVGLKFDKDALFTGESAKEIQVWFNLSQSTSEKWHKYTTMTYNEDTGLYEAYQKHSGYTGGETYIDGNTGATLTFRNVLILRTPNETLKNKNGWMNIDVVGEGEGYFACNGQMTKIKWSRPTESDPYTYTLEDGTPITLGIGKSYIAIIPMTGHIDAK
jgi:hypothetical protein